MADIPKLAGTFDALRVTVLISLNDVEKALARYKQAGLHPNLADYDSREKAIVIRVSVPIDRNQIMIGSVPKQFRLLTESFSGKISEATKTQLMCPNILHGEATLRSIEEELVLANASSRAKYQWLEDRILSLFNNEADACVLCDRIPVEKRYSYSQVLSALIGKYADLELVVKEASRLKTHGRTDKDLRILKGVIDLECDCLRVSILLEAVKRATVWPLVKREMLSELQISVPGEKETPGLPVLLVRNNPYTVQQVIDLAKDATIKGQVVTDKVGLQKAIESAAEPDDEPSHEFLRDFWRHLKEGYLVCAIVGD